MYIGDYIRYLRTQKGLTQEELGKMLGVQRAAVQKWEAGAVKNLKRDIIAELSKIFDVSPANFVEADIQSLTPVPGDTYNIPIYESVSAGFGAAAVDSVIDYMPLPFKSRYEAEQTILIKVQGDSMIPKIEDGDLIQVHRQTSVDSGDLAVVILDGDNGLVKKVEYTDDTVTLISLNLNYPPIKLSGSDVKRCQVVGKVKRIVREV